MSQEDLQNGARARARGMTHDAPPPTTLYSHNAPGKVVARARARGESGPCKAVAASVAYARPRARGIGTTTPRQRTPARPAGQTSARARARGLLVYYLFWQGG